MKTYQEMLDAYRKRQKSTVVDTIAAGLTYMDEIAVDTGLLEETGLLDELTGTEPPQIRPIKKSILHPGLLLCLVGAVGLILLGLLALAAPEQTATLDQSSMVTIRGTGLLMTVSAAVLAVGAWLLLRKK